MSLTDESRVLEPRSILPWRWRHPFCIIFFHQARFRSIWNRISLFLRNLAPPPSLLYSTLHRKLPLKQSTPDFVNSPNGNERIRIHCIELAKNITTKLLIVKIPFVCFCHDEQISLNLLKRTRGNDTMTDQYTRRPVSSFNNTYSSSRLSADAKTTDHVLRIRVQGRNELQ